MCVRREENVLPQNIRVLIGVLWLVSGKNLLLEDKIEALRRMVAANAARTREAERASTARALEAERTNKNFINALREAQKKNSSHDEKLENQARDIEFNSAKIDNHSKDISEIRSQQYEEEDKRKMTDHKVAVLEEKVDDLTTQMKAEQPISTATDSDDAMQRLFISNVRATRHSNEITRNFAENMIPLVQEVVTHFKSNSGQLSTVVTNPNNPRGPNDQKTQQVCGQRNLAYKDKTVLDYTEKNRLSAEVSIEAQLIAIFREQSMLLYGIGYYRFVTHPGF